MHIAHLFACVIVGLAASPLAEAQTQWQASVGAQNASMGHQALAFLPNELWIHAGDSVTWRFAADEIHTVSFMITDQVRPLFFLGCGNGPPPGATPDGSPFDGSLCVNSGPSVSGQSYTVNFPTAGNYKLVCLVHEGMTGTVHVLDPSSPLPHDQAYYDHVAATTRHDLLADRHGNRNDDEGAMDDGDDWHGQQREVTAGAGNISATPGGQQSVSVMRFMQSRVEIRVGGTVEWNNVDPATPHTITFGTEPANPAIPVNATPDADGGLSATINFLSDSANSGLIVAAGLERIGVALAPLNATHFRVTFTHPGTYPYKCALHDNLGMMGVVVVRP